MTSFHLVLLNTGAAFVYEKNEITELYYKGPKRKRCQKYFKTNCFSQNVLK